MKQYVKTNVGSEGRVELHNTLSLTGAEISVNRLPAGACVPFVHAHKHNEEIYAILAGSGKAVIDGETVALTAGDWLKIEPAAKRQFFAAENEGIEYVCIQVRENSSRASRQTTRSLAERAAPYGHGANRSVPFLFHRHAVHAKERHPRTAIDG